MTCVGITSLAAAWNAILSGSSQTGSVKQVMRRPSSPRYERPNPAEIRFAGSGSREAQSQGSSFKPFLEQDLAFSRWSAKPRHVEGAEIALIARAAKWCHELVVDLAVSITVIVAEQKSGRLQHQAEGGRSGLGFHCRRSRIPDIGGRRRADRDWPKAHTSGGEGQECRA